MASNSKRNHPRHREMDTSRGTPRARSKTPSSRSSSSFPSSRPRLRFVSSISSARRRSSSTHFLMTWSCVRAPRSLRKSSRRLFWSSTFFFAWASDASVAFLSLRSWSSASRCARSASATCVICIESRSRPKCAQNHKRDHPRPRLMEASRIDGVTTTGRRERTGSLMNPFLYVLTFLTSATWSSMGML